MNIFGFKVERVEQEPNFVVTIRTTGLHPYVTDENGQRRRDYKDAEYDVEVYATSWNKAEKIALSKTHETGVKAWGYWVEKIRRKE